MGKKAKTILVVDDDLENTRSYSEILTDLCYRVITRSDVNSALELLRNEKEVDLVITDYRMDRMDGLDLMRAIRSKRPTTLVILMTAFGSDEVQAEAEGLQAYRYITKPFPIEEFQRIVREALNSGRLVKSA